MINKVILEGRIAKPFDLRKTSSGASVVNFSIASERVHKQSEKEVDYINCVAWNKVADNLNKFCDKGSLLSVVGRLQTRSYSNTNGQTIYVTEILCEEIHFLGRKTDIEKNKQHQVEQQQLKNDFDSAFDNFDIQPDDLQF